MSASLNQPRLPIQIRTTIKNEVQIIYLLPYLVDSNKSDILERLVANKTRSLDWTEYDHSTVERAINFMYSSDKHQDAKPKACGTQMVEVERPILITSSQENFQPPAAVLPWSRTRSFISSSSSFAAIASSLQYRDEQGQDGYIEDDHQEILQMAKLYTFACKIGFPELKETSFKKMALILDSITKINEDIYQAIWLSKDLLFDMDGRIKDDHVEDCSMSHLLAHFVLLNYSYFNRYEFVMLTSYPVQQETSKQLPRWFNRGRELQLGEQHCRKMERHNRFLRQQLKRIMSRITENRKKRESRSSTKPGSDGQMQANMETDYAGIT